MYQCGAGYLPRPFAPHVGMSLCASVTSRELVLLKYVPRVRFGFCEGTFIHTVVHKGAVQVELPSFFPVAEPLCQTLLLTSETLRSYIPCFW